MLREAISGDVGLIEFITYAISAIVVIFLTMPVHEFAHAFAANKLGDPTAKFMGRLSINPLRHIDWVGAAVALAAFAGPLSNLIVAFVSVFFMFLVSVLLSWFDYSGYITAFFYYIAIINIHLAVFNLIPIPPLDGSKILAAILPNNIYYKIMQYERYVYIVLVVLLYTGVLSRPLGVISNVIFSGFIRLFSMIFSLFI